MVDILANLLPGSNLPLGVNLSLPVSGGSSTTTIPAGDAGSVTVNGAGNGSGLGASIGDTALGVLLPGGGSGGALDLSSLGALGGLVDLGDVTGDGLTDFVPNLLSGLPTDGLIGVEQGSDGSTTVNLLGGTGGGGTGVTIPNLLGGLLPNTNQNTATPLPSVETAYANIFRTWNAPAPEIQAQLEALKAMVAGGQITQTQAILQIVHAAAPFTGVAAATYQFFTGRGPSADGLTYLVNSSQNPTDLNDAYYQPFNTENRFINFASNLGLHGEGSAEFQSAYGSLTFEQAVQKAYGDIIGLSASTNGGFASGGAVADIVSRKSYFDQVATERFGGESQDLAVKLTAIGYILQEAVRGGVGLYGEGVENFLFDLADGQAQANVDLVGVYGPSSIYNID